MTMKSFYPYRMKYKKDKQEEFRMVLHQLEKTGRALCGGRTSRELSKYLVTTTTDRDKFCFGHTNNKECIVIVKPGYMLVKTPRNKYTIKVDKSYL